MTRILCLAGICLLFAACGGKESGSGSDAPAPSADPPEASAPVATEFDPATAGSIQGSVRFDGDPPAPELLAMDSDKWCKDHAGPSGVDESIVVNDGNLANVFVYIKSGLEGVEFPAATEPVVLDQVGCVYTPHVVGIQLGQDVRMRNSDNVLHNVHTRPEVNKGRNIAMPSKNMERDFPFKQPEIMIPVTCDVHPWMRAYINVVEHPCFAVSAADGSFTIDGVPPGDYTVELRHEKLGTQEVQVTVPASGTATLDPVSFSE